MSDIFENDIDIPPEDLAALEDPPFEEAPQIAPDGLVFPVPLYKLLLEYSSESVYASFSGESPIERGRYVVIPTRYGKDLARVLGVVTAPMGVRPADVVVIERAATQSDLDRMADFRKKEKDAFSVFQEKVAAHKLEMKLISTHYLLEEQKILFFFSAETRIDFRELVKDLVSVFRMRIELRQIGVRDESRITGGLGVCGRPYCCHGVSDKLRPVSIRMAKDQNLSLNSMKISGQCGRLLCCLSYEHEWYAEAKKSLPNEGVRLLYDGTTFRVSEVNPLSMMVKMNGEDGRVLEIAASRLKNVDGKWKVVG